MSNHSTRLVAALLLLLVAVPVYGQRRGGGGGRSMGSRSMARSSVSRGSFGGGARPGYGGGVNRANVNRNVNRNVNVDRDYGINNRYDNGYGCCNYRPVARAAAVTAGVAIGAAAVGSTVYSLPSSCTEVVVNGYAYQQCGSTWYQPQFVGDATTYTVVSAP